MLTLDAHWATFSKNLGSSPSPFFCCLLSISTLLLWKCYYTEVTHTIQFRNSVEKDEQERTTSDMLSKCKLKPQFTLRQEQVFGKKSTALYKKHYTQAEQSLKKSKQKKWGNFQRALKWNYEQSHPRNFSPRTTFNASRCLSNILLHERTWTSL